MPAADVELGVGYLVKRVQQALRRRCDAALRPIGISMAQYAVLRALADHPAASAAELARLCFVTRQSLQDTLGGLRAGGFVEDGEQRGRARALRLTRLGTTQLSAAHAAVLDVESDMLDGMAETGQAQLARMLTRCAERLERRPAFDAR